MSLIDFIEKLQNKPYHTRVVILWFSVAISMLIIVMIWVFSFRFGGQFVQSQKAELSSLLSPFESVKGLFSSFKKEASIDLKNMVERLEEEVEEEELVPKSKPAKLPVE